ncbi:MAG: alginate lyase family protein [Planctomycetia bacterium]|nr:alginate lyase family protein [Planctomycetia bacterium]
MSSTAVPRILCVLILWTVAAGARGAEQPTFAVPPRLAISSAELKKLKEGKEFAALRDTAVRAADALLQEPVTPPDGWGNWVFYYACPDDGSPLQARSATEHVCPRCQKVCADERTVQAYRTLLHDRANAAALQLGWAYAYTGDERYARAVRRILLKYADDYASYPKRRDRWGREGWLARLGGRRYSQSLDEAVGILPLAKAYDLTRLAAAWDEPSRQHVETDFFRATADTLLYANQDVNNHQTWYNAGLLALASVLGDAPLVDRVLTMRGGYRDQLQRATGGEGLWYEGALAYHHYALQAMIEIVDAGRRLGLPLHEEPRFKAMLLAPLRCAYPNGQFPAINDSDPGSIDSFRPSFLWGWRTYGDERFARAYAGRDPQQLAALLGPDARPGPVVETKSENLADAGLAVLRGGQGADAACVMLDYGPHGGGHGHYDKLSIVLFAGGREWLVDPGRLTYSHKEYQTWVKHTAAHNTVTLGGRSQSATTGKLLWFAARNGYSACAAESDGAYAGAKLTRYLLLADSMLVDVFDVEAEQATQIDWFAHAVSQTLEPVGAQRPGAPAVPGVEDGYRHLTGARAWDVPGATRWDFVAGPKQRLRLWLAGADPEKVFTCTGIGYSTAAKVPCLIRRREAKQTRFIAVYDLSADAGFVKQVKPADPAKPHVNIETRTGRWRVEFDRPEVRVTIE